MRKRRKKNYHADRAFVDLLFNAFLGFVALFFIALLLINPVEKKNDIKLKAEFIIKVTWPEKSNDDVDSYLQDPAGNLLWYNARDVGLMHLDRDDLGYLNDVIHLPNGETVTLKENREIITIRGIIPGEYIMNVHLFNRNYSYDGEYEYDENGNLVNEEGNVPREGEEDGYGEPIEVTVEVVKLNPYQIVSVRKVTLTAPGDEKTVLRFTLDKDGNVVDTNTLEKKFVGNPNGPGGGQ